MSNGSGYGEAAAAKPTKPASSVSPVKASSSNRLNFRVADGLFDPDLIRRAVEQWPDAFWPHWINYDTEEQQKQTCREWWKLPPACQALLFEMLKAEIPEMLGFDDLIPDIWLWGAGLCHMHYGQSVGLHLDHDVHPQWKRRRRATSILFLTGDSGSVGLAGGSASGSLSCPSGQLRFATLDEHTGEPTDVAVISPMPNRLVAFENGPDYPWHHVTTWKGEIPRMSLCVFWYNEHVEEEVVKSTHTKAVFAG